MAKIQEKQQAQKLRATGMSIKQIADMLQISKSTVSVWCRDINLNTSAKQALLQNTKARNTAGLLAYSERKRTTRQITERTNKKIGQNTLGTLLDRDIYCIGLGLYWGEGYKRGNREFGFTNSDPDMIRFYLIWLEKVFTVTSKDIVLRVSINAQHTHRINQVQSYWSKLTNIPLSQFTKPSLIQTVSKKQFDSMEHHFGTLRVKVRNGSNYREQILGAIEHINLT